MEVLRLDFENITPVAARAEKMEVMEERSVDVLSMDELSEEKEIEVRVEDEGEMWDKIEGE
jgi:hypothetical protein